MKSYKIQLFDKNNVVMMTMVSQHIDASPHVTCFFENDIDDDFVLEFTLTEKIDHINIIDGMITIYYQNEHFVEITLLNKNSYCLPGTHHGVNTKGKKY